MTMRFLTALLLIAISPVCALADGLKSLEQFISQVHSGRAEFTQTVTSPAKEGQAPRVRTSNGSFEFLRPNRFKFVYRKPFAQTMVGDGQTLWLFDADLNQVTARPQAQTLGNTPAALIASGADMSALQAHFSLQAAPDRDGLSWVLATPKARDGVLQSVRLGFAEGALRVLEITDPFAQRTVLSFKDMALNPSLSADSFVFTPPKGADLLRP